MTNTNAGAGVFVAVVGPSGSGKDSVLNYASARLGGEEGFHFARRVITRTALEEAEDHDTLSTREFAAAAASGQFAIHWHAHGLDYALAATINDQLARGGVVIANVSRSVLVQLRQRYAQVIVVHLTATPDVLAARLAARGRESAADIEARLRRSHRTSMLCDMTVIDNSGPLEQAGECFLALLRNAGPNLGPSLSPGLD